MPKRMPTKRSAPQGVKRICTMCSKAFVQVPRPGRPSAFCSAECLDRSKRSPTRYCISCTEPFTVKGNPYGPFYCSEACQSMHPCQQCGAPTHTKFCSIKCVQKAHPPPYECRVCGNKFLPSKGFLKRQRSLEGPPRYCSGPCFDQRHSHHPDAPRPRDRQLTIDYKLQCKRLEAIKFASPYELPVRPNGAPWVGVAPMIPIKQLHYMSQNTIRFWDHIFNSTTALDGLTPHQYTAFMFEFVCRRKYDTVEYAIQEGWTLWPYIAEYTDHRYDPQLFESMATAYLRTRRNMLKLRGAMDRPAIQMMVRRCVDAFIVETSPTNVTKGSKHKTFCRTWITPLMIIRAPYDHRDIPGRQQFYSKIQIEVSRYYSSLVELHTKPWDTYLGPMTKEAYQPLVDAFAKVIKQMEPMHHETKNPWPWGPNRYNDFKKHPYKDPTQESIDTILTTSNYNLPEPTL